MWSVLADLVVADYVVGSVRTAAVGSGPGAGGGPACARIQVCMAIPLATPALIDRVEPYCAME